MSNAVILINIALIVASYFIGNISPATMIAGAKGHNIRAEGSGNPGTTNMLRTVGKKGALLTLAIDILKGVAAVWLGRIFGGEYIAVYCGIAAFVGHCWPVCFRFKGGKGIATGLGILLALSWPMGLICLGAACVFFVTLRIVSVGSIAAVVVMPVAAWFFCPEYFPWSFLLTALVIFNHRKNVVRLIRGEEPRFSFKSKK